MTATNLYDKYADRLEAGEEVLPYSLDWPNSKPTKERTSRKAKVAQEAKNEPVAEKPELQFETPEGFDEMSTSAKSRYLVLGQGFSIAQVAKYLNVRYQQVYQVIKKEESKRLEASS